MAVTTCVILFLFTGSVVQPLRALVLKRGQRPEMVLRGLAGGPKAR